MITEPVESIFAAIQTAKDAPEVHNVDICLTEFGCGGYRTSVVPLSDAHVGFIERKLSSLPEVKIDDTNVFWKYGLRVEVDDGIALVIPFGEVPRMIEVLSAAMGDTFLRSLQPKEKSNE